MQHFMSSNISIPKVCNHCGKTYIAHKTTTRYCSHKCNSRDYKLKAKQDKIEKTLLEQQNIIVSKNDTQILNEVFEGRVDILISEDKKIHTKANLLGIAHKVYKIQNFCNCIIR